MTPDSQLIEFAGHKVRLTVILGVLARNIRPITFTFGPPVFGGYPDEEEGELAQLRQWIGGHHWHRWPAPW